MAENCGCKYDTMERVSQKPVDLSASLRPLVPPGCEDMTHRMGGLPAGCEDMTRWMPLQFADFAKSGPYRVAPGQAGTCDKSTVHSSAYAITESVAGMPSPSFPTSYVPRTVGSEDAFPIEFRSVTEGGSEVLRPSSRLRIVDPRAPRQVHIVGENQRKPETSSEFRWVR
jgi:hypothetical protein